MPTLPKMKNGLDTDYKLIPMNEITDEARTIAVRWMECEDKNWIGNKHKLASDIMNYARQYHSAKLTEFTPQNNKYLKIDFTISNPNDHP